MTDAQNRTTNVNFVLTDSAQSAVFMIMNLLGDSATESEAIQRALGTELYLLQRMKEGAKLVLLSKGQREEIDLYGPILDA